MHTSILIVLLTVVPTVSKVAAVLVMALAIVAGAVLSAIEWTDATWNPVTGCTRVSRGCDLCYAVAMSRRLAACGQQKYTGLVGDGKAHFNGVVKLHVDELQRPHGWKKPRRVFVNSMSDLFHPSVPTWFIVAVFRVMAETPRHQYQVLTKRPERLAEIDAVLEAALGDWPENVLMGVSVEDADVLGRVDLLRACGAKVKFISAEPLLGPLTGLDLTGIDWVIVGGESGHGARPMEIGWARAIRDLCVATGTAFYFKQWGAHDERGRRGSKKANGRVLDGRTWNEHPVELRAA